VINSSMKNVNKRKLKDDKSKDIVDTLLLHLGFSQMSFVLAGYHESCFHSTASPNRTK